LTPGQSQRVCVSGQYSYKLQRSTSDKQERHRTKIYLAIISRDDRSGCSRLPARGLAFDVRLPSAVGCAAIVTDDWPMDADAEIAIASDTVKP